VHIRSFSTIYVSNNSYQYKIAAIVYHICFNSTVSFEIKSLY